MAIRFPESSELKHSTESEMEHIYDHAMVLGGNHAQVKFSSPRGVAIDPNTNCIYVAEILFPPPVGRVLIYSEEGELVDALISEHFTSPWGIAIHNDDLYVTDNKQHSVFRFKIAPDFKFVCKIGGLGVGVGFFKSPRQLAVSTDGNLFVADRTNHRVVILNSNLQYQRCIKHFTLKLPRDVKLTTDEVFVLCTGIPIIVFSYAGYRIRNICLSFQLTNPLFFCLDANKNIFTTNDTCGEVKIYSKEGGFLYTLQRERFGMNVMNSPGGIVTTINSKLIVVSGGREKYFTNILVILTNRF